MKFINTVALVGLCVALVGCQTPISSSPISGITGTPAGNALAKDLQDASYNLDQAVTVGALSATDPAPPCLTAVLVQLGLSGTPPASYTPEVNGPVSLGSVIYIRTQQALALAGAGTSAVPTSCEALIGQIVIDAGKAGLQVGGVLLPSLPGL